MRRDLNPTNLRRFHSVSRSGSVETTMRFPSFKSLNVILNRSLAALILMLLVGMALAPQAAAQTTDCTFCDAGKPQSLVFLNNADTAKYILVQDSGNDNTYFQGWVNPGDAFTANGTDTDGKFHTNDVQIILLDAEPANLNQSRSNTDLNVIQIHVSCSKPIFLGMDPALQPEKEDPNPQDVGLLTLIGGFDTAGAELCPETSCAICTDGSKVTSVTFRHEGDQAKYILVQDNGNDNTYFQGWVNPGEEFTANGTDTDGKFHKNDIEIILLDAEPASLTIERNPADIDVILVHVSCSKPLFYGMDPALQEGKEDPNAEDVGKLTLTGGTTTSGQEICRPIIDLELVKTAGDPENGQVTYTITVFNNDANAGVAATGVRVSDVLPAGVSYVSSSATRGSYSPSTWNVYYLEPGESATLTILADIVDITDMENCAEVSAANEEDIDSTPNNGVGNGEDDQACADPYLPTIDLELQKTGEVTGNGTVSYTLTVFNNDAFANTDATGVEVEDVLPVGVTYVSSVASQGSYSPSTWTVGSLAPGASATLTIQATFTSDADLTNCAEVMSANENDYDSTPGNGFDNGEDDFACSPPDDPRVDLRLEKDVDKSEASFGDALVYTLTVTNESANDATGVEVQDVLPEGLSFTLSSPGAPTATWDAGSRTITWNVGNLAAGQNKVLSIATVWNVSQNPNPTMIQNCAEISAMDQIDVDSTPGNGSGNGEDDEDCASTGRPVIDLELDKAYEGPANGQITYTVSVINNDDNATVDATGVTVGDVLPAGAAYVSSVASQGSYSPSTWTVGTLAPGASATLTITANVSNANDLDNCAQVMTANEDDIDSTPGNGTNNNEDDEACVDVPGDGPVIDLELDKSYEGPANGQITYTISVFNNDANATVAATGVTVEDVLPDGASFVSYIKTQGSYNSGTGIWNVGTLFPGATATMVITANVVDGNDLDNCAEVMTANENDVDSTPGNGFDNNEDDKDCVDVPGDDPVIDLELDKSYEGPANGQITYTVSVFNNDANATVDATNVTVEDVLPAGASYVSSAASQGAYAPSTWTVGTLAPGATATLVITANVTDANDLDNCAQVMTADETDVDSTPGNGYNNNEDDKDCVTVPGDDPVIDLELDKSYEGPANGQITYTVSVFNNDANATVDATNVTVEDVLPAGASYVSSAASQGAYAPSTWTVGTLAPGATATLVITANVTDANDLDNCAQVMTADETDVDSTPGNGYNNNEDDKDCVTVPGDDPKVDIEVEKTASTLSPDFGESFTYTITVTNNGPADATNLEITEDLPAGLNYVSHVTSAGAWNDGTGLWLLSSLAAGDSETLVITVQVNGTSSSLAEGQFLLHNHPGNDLAPPGFGLRLDELFGGLKGITFDFDHPDSYVVMTVDGDDVVIDGVVYGGHDVGASYDPATEGLWDVHFEYTNVVSSVPGDDDLYVNDADSEVSTGTISPQFNSAWFSAGDVFDLKDKSDGSYSFRLGDENDDNGYNGYSGISGWGWLMHGQNGNLVHAPISDWLFTATPMNNSIVNCAELTALTETDSDSVPADGEGDDYACITIIPGDPVVDLGLEKSVDQTDAAVGDVITYTLTVENDAAAGATATNVIAQDVLPSGVQFLQSNPASNVTFDNGSNTVSWMIPSLAPGASVQLDIEVRILEGGQLTNCAEVMSADQTDADDIYGDGTGEDFDCATTTTNDPFIDLYVDKAAYPTNPGLGDVVDYTITVRNDASATQTAFGVQVVDNVPAGMSIQSTNPTSNVSVNTTTNIVSWLIPSLAPGAEVVLHIYAQVNEPGDWVNCAEIMAATGTTSNTFGDGQGQDIDCVTTSTPDPTIDLSLVKTVDNATPALGAEITYTLAVTNSAPATETATGVVVEDQLPAGVTLSPAFSNPNVTVSPSGLITWNVGSVPKGDVAMLDIPVTVSVSAIQQNCAQITAADQDDVDSTPDNGIGNGEDDESCVTITPNLNPPNLMCYVLADNEDHTGSADVLTYISTAGTEIVIGLTGTNNINAIEFVGATSKLFAIDGGTLGTINPANGLFSPIGSLGSGQGALGGQTFDNVSGLALDPFTGILYASVRKSGEDLLIQVNTLTGQAVTNAFGPAMTYVVIPAVSGQDDVEDIAINPQTGVMYAVVNGGGASRIVTIDKTTGASAAVAVADVTNIRGLAFKADGTLLGTLGSTANQVREINLSTGATTLVSSLGAGGNFDYEALTCNTNAPNTLSGTVYLDNNEDAELNSGDVGQAGVTVQLWKDNNSDGIVNGGDFPVGTVVTDANGFYAFHVLTSGYYVVQTDLGTYPAGATLTTDNVETAHFPGHGDSDTGNDFGFKLEPVVLGSIGDEVFVDENGNGVRDTGEAGMTGILIRLYNGACPATGTPLATRVSNASGGYDFTMLPAGTYCVDVDNATVPSGYALTTANDPMTVVIGNGEDFNLADFGFYFDPQAVEADLELTKEVDTSSPALDGVVEFTITVTNNGPADATGLIVRDIIPVGLVFQDYSSSKGTYEANKLGYWTIGELPVGHTETLKIRTKVVITNMIENIAQVSHVDQEDPDSTPGNGVPSEDDQDNAIVESRGPGSVGDIIAVECADLGTVNSLQYSTFDGQIYSGTEVGTVHISNDDGQNWPAFLNTDGEAPVRDIVIDGNGWVYAGSFGSGVYRSTDSGDNWTNLGPVGGSINDLDIDDNTNTAYAAAHGEVLRLSGLSWQTVGASSNPFAGDQVLAVVYQESNNTLLATSAASGTWIFDGSTWTSADTGLPNGKVNVLFRSPDGIVLAGHNNRGVFMWGGSSWMQLGMGLDNEPIESIGSGPNGEVLAGSRETGAYFLNKITGEWLSIGNLPVFTVSAMTGGPTGEVYAGAPGEGIYVIYDQDFDGIPDIAHQVANFMTSAIIQDLVVAPNGDMWAATYGYGILYSKDGGNCWTRMNRGLDNLWTFAIDRTSDGTLFIGIWADGLGGIWRSKDDGRNWEFLAYGTRQIISLAVDPINEDIIYAGANIAGEGALFRSMDGGDTWSDVGNFIYPVWSVTVDPTDNNHVFVGTMGAGIYESFDQGATFEQVGSPTNGLDNPYVFDMVYAPQGTPYAGQLFAATDAGVYRYDTFAQAWTLFGEYSEDFQFRTIAFTGTEIYGGTWNAGVVQYNALTNEWADYGLSDMPVVAFAVHQQSETLVIGTSGSGVFLAPNLRMSTDVEDDVIGSEIPTSFALDQNYPNPFNPQTTIPFDLRETTRVKMAVYDMLGREVGMLVDGTLQAGQHQVTWDAGDVPSGTYLVRMEAAGQTFTRTMILLK